ncbi:TnsA endonuclease N-terminal domain-containing protein [Shewanella algae]|uniref:TnsA endonuclease N-terminal domain-containing protein n=1 Tax=Shewanella algae TaxID=38313 RepID=UPI00313C1F85
MGKTIMCESSLEFDACFHHEYNESVRTFDSQPEGFYYQYEGKDLPYTPDTIVQYIDRRIQFHEYKPLSKTFDPIFKAKFYAKRQAAQLLGMELILVTDEQIRVNPVLNNLKLLHRYSGAYTVCDTQRELLSRIRASGKCRLTDIADENVLTMGEVRSYIFSLLNKGLLKSDVVTDDFTLNPSVWCG